MVNEEKELHLEHDWEGQDEAHFPNPIYDINHNYHLGQPIEEYVSALNSMGFVGYKFWDDGWVHLLPVPKLTNSTIFCVAVLDPPKIKSVVWCGSPAKFN